MSKTYEIEMKKRVEKTRELVNKFNKRYEGGTVYLSLNNEKEDALYATFTIKFRFSDPFVDHEIYHSGSAYTYPSEALYLVLDVLAGDDKIDWNNTRSTGWLTYPEAEEK
jgi:hypothetical protein